MDSIDAIRRFNRFYTRRIGALNEGLVDPAYTLTQTRVLYELAHRSAPTAVEVADALGLDAGYLSRLLRGFEDAGLLTRAPSSSDGRQSHLEMTGAGRAVFAPLEQAARDQVEALLDRLPPGGEARLVAAMGEIAALLGAPPAPVRLRAHRIGDMGWVVQRHGALYAQEYGWDARFEALVARIVADFIDHFDPAGERCWIAEGDGAPVGSVFVVRASPSVARLRLLLVDPASRGLGVGRSLLDAAIGFARDAGYRTLTLWTNDILAAARRLYQQAGFRLVAEEPHHSFGAALVGQTWELALDQ